VDVGVDETKNFVTRRYDNEASFYDLLYNPTDDIPFYEKLANEAKGPILELACGTGRITLPLARAGSEIIGLDASRKMLDVARSKLRQEKAEVRRRVRFIRGDMRTFSLSQRFTLCFIPFFSFHHLLSEDDQLRTLAVVRKHLLPKGRLVFDVFNPDLSRPEGLQRLDKVVEAQGKTTMRYSAQWFDRENQVTHGWLIYEFLEIGGTVKRTITPFRLKYFFIDDVKQLLRRAGFHVNAVYGNYDRSRFTPKSPMMIFIAQQSG
jgi:SAM-dependent methyltransferase